MNKGKSTFQGEWGQGVYRSEPVTPVQATRQRAAIYREWGMTPTSPSAGSRGRFPATSEFWHGTITKPKPEGFAWGDTTPMPDVQRDHLVIPKLEPWGNHIPKPVIGSMHTPKSDVEWNGNFATQTSKGRNAVVEEDRMVEKYRALGLDFAKQAQNPRISPSDFQRLSGKYEQLFYDFTSMSLKFNEMVKDYDSLNKKYKALVNQRKPSTDRKERLIERVMNILREDEFAM